MHCPKRPENPFPPKAAASSKISSRILGPLIIDKLNKEINAGLADPKLRATLIDMGATILAGSPSDYAKLIAEGTEKWGKVIRAANIKPE